MRDVKLKFNQIYEIWPENCNLGALSYWRHTMETFWHLGLCVVLLL